MFDFFKKRSSFPSSEELSRLSKSACSDVQSKWLHFNETVTLKSGITLAQKIDFFAQPLTQFFKKKYLQLLLGGSEIFWLTTFTAILESGTHAKQDVNAAIEELRSKYAGKA